MHQIEILGKPISWQRTGLNCGRFYDQQAKDRRTYQWRFKQQFSKNALIGPIKIEYTFIFSAPKSASLLKKKKLLNTYYVGVNDLDNLCKFVADCGNGILWKDDRQIVALSAVKLYGEIEKTIIRFEEC